MSLPTLVIGTKKLSTWSLRSWLALRHFDIVFDEVELPLDTPEYYRRIEEISPTRRVPVLVDGDLRIWDSLAICEYVNELSGGAGWPKEREARAQARSICAEMHSGFQALRNCWPMQAGATNLRVALNNDARADIDRIQSIWSECRSRHRDAGPWLFGSYSIADAMYAPVVLRFESYGAQLTDASHEYTSTVLADKHLRAWIDAARLQP
jgi:glutathione S-transferase